MCDHKDKNLRVEPVFQSLHPLDPSRLFGWQAANTFHSTGEQRRLSAFPFFSFLVLLSCLCWLTEASELPHFSSPHLVSRFALLDNLDFLYYLRHGRPSFAFATFLSQQLSGCADVSLG